MRAVLGLLALGLCAQSTFGKIDVQSEKEHSIVEGHGLRGGYAKELQAATAADNVYQSDVPPGDSLDFEAIHVSEHPEPRELWPVNMVCTVVGIAVEIEVDITITIIITGGAGVAVDIDINVTVSVSVVGVVIVELPPIDNTLLNGDLSGLCSTCTLEVIAGGCVAGDCEGYDMDASNQQLIATVSPADDFSYSF